MPADERLSSLAGDKPFQELEELKKGCRELIDLILELNKSAKGFEFNLKGAGSLKDVVNGQNEVIGVQEKLAKATSLLGQEYSDTIKIMSVMNGHSKEFVQVQREVLKLKADEEKLDQRRIKNTKAQSDAYGELSSKYNQASRAAKNLAVIYGESDARAVEASKSAKELGDQLKRIDASVGQYGRSVGNYSSATNGLRNSMQQIARELPSISNGFATFASAIGNNIAPAQDAVRAFKEEQKALAAEGKPTESIFKALSNALINWQTGLLLGVTLLTVYGKEIGQFIGNLFSSKDAIDKLKKSEEEEFNLRKKINDSYGQEVSKLLVLKARIEDVNLPMAVRLQGVKDIQEEFPKYFKNLSQEALLAGNVGDAYLKTANAIRSAARVRVFGEELGKVEGQMATLEDRILGNARGGEITKNALGGYNAVPVPGSAGFPSYKTGEKGKDGKAIMSNLLLDTQLYNSLLVKSEALTGKITQNLAAAATIDKPEKDKKGKKDRHGQDFTNETLKAENELTAALYDQLKQRSDNSAKTQKKIAEDDTNNLQKRVDAYQNYTFELINMAGIEEAKEKQIIQNKLDKIKEIEGKNIKDRTNEEKALLLQKEGLEVRMANVTEKYEGVRSDIVEENVKFQTKLISQYAKESEDAINRSKRNLEGITTVVGLPGEDGFNGDNGRTTSEASYEKHLQRQEQYASKAIDFAHSLAAINSSITQQRVKELDEEIAAIQKRTEAEIEGINASAKSATDKEEAIAAAKARADVNIQQLEAQKRERLRRAAAFEKAVTISQIIAETALAVVRALGSRPYSPANIGLAAATGAVGAAQLAAALAAPLPSYAEGTDDHKGGPAIMGERGTEMVIEPGGKAWFTAGQATLYPELKKHSQVITNEELMNLTKMYTLGVPAMVPVMGHDSKGIETALAKQTETITEAIKQSPRTEVNITGKGITHFVKSGQSSLQYLHNIKLD